MGLQEMELEAIELGSENGYEDEFMAEQILHAEEERKSNFGEDILDRIFGYEV